MSICGKTTMATATRPDPYAIPHPALVERGFFRLSVADYHDLGERGILTPDDRVELIDGYLVLKPMQNRPHATTVDRLTESSVLNLQKRPWRARFQLPVGIGTSEPEPDAVVVRGDARTFAQRHPQASEIALVIEVSDSTLRGDREVKGPISARAGIPIYWIVNLPEAKVEVYTLASGPSDDPKYSHRQDFTAGDPLPLMLDGQFIAQLSVAALLP